MARTLTSETAGRVSAVHDGGARDLSRRLQLIPATNIVVANMIGVGIFTTSGLLLQELGSPVFMIALWIGGGIRGKPGG